MSQLQALLIPVLCTPGGPVGTSGPRQNHHLTYAQAASYATWVHENHQLTCTSGSSFLTLPVFLKPWGSVKTLRILVAVYFS